VQNKKNQSKYNPKLMKTIPTRTNLNALNDQQRKAVLSSEKRILVLAGAGSGKTKTLLNKINYLINDEQADSNSILAITFTKNAANEMIDRMILSADKTGFYKKIMASKGITQKELSVERKKMLHKYAWLNQITIKTFHSLCYQIMREEGVNVFDNQFKLVSKSIDNSSEFKGISATEIESEIIQKVAIQLSENRNYLIDFKRFIIDYYVDNIREDEGGAEFRPEGKLFTTLKGDKVRSKSEQFIADWFFRNNKYNFRF
jgi:superfamily I DNA/RNA helicase